MSAIVLGAIEEVKPRDVLRDIPMSEVRLTCRDAAARYRLRQETAPVEAAREQLRVALAPFGLRLPDHEATRVAVAVVLAYLREV